MGPQNPNLIIKAPIYIDIDIDIHIHIHIHIHIYILFTVNVVRREGWGFCSWGFRVRGFWRFLATVLQQAQLQNIASLDGWVYATPGTLLRLSFSPVVSKQDILSLQESFHQQAAEGTLACLMLRALVIVARMWSAEHYLWSMRYCTPLKVCLCMETVVVQEALIPENQQGVHVELVGPSVGAWLEPACLEPSCFNEASAHVRMHRVLNFEELTLKPQVPQ